VATQQKKVLRKRLLLWGVPSLLVLAVIVVALLPESVPADLAPVVRGDLLVTVDEEGETRVRDRFVVSAPVPGRLLRIALEPGDEVVAGETVLATFQPSTPVPLDARSRAEAEARVKAAEATLGSAEANDERADAELRYAESVLARYHELAKEEIVSSEQLEKAELDLETRRKSQRATEFEVRNAEHALAAARAALVEAYSSNPGHERGDPIVLYSPIDGTVLKRLRWSEAVVPVGEPLLEVGDADDIEIVSDLLSTDAVRVQPGQRVLVEQWGGERPLAGVVRRVEPYGFTKFSALGVEEQRVNVIIDFTGDPEARRSLGDGYRVEVRIVVWEGDGVLQVPTSSLFRHGETWAVWAVVGGTAVLREIETGARNGLDAQVLSGLEEGAQVIVHPSDAIVEGVKVERRGGRG
jgi:HlyD family secretion protein